MATRDDVLNRIRAALGRTQPLTSAQAAAMRDKLARHPRGPLPSMSWDRVARFRERCLSLSSTVDDVASLDAVPEAVARFLSANALGTNGVCWPQFAELDWSAAGLAIEARAPQERDTIGITGAYCAIAETGTLMLLSAPTMPAVTSLVPETHIAVVPVSRIVPAMEDGWDLLRREHGDLPRQVAFVSGPSRTADIEMTLVLGIHGPYRVHILLVNGAQ
jgi:L-lactate dehydrogenase complex protein LldG